MSAPAEAPAAAGGAHASRQPISYCPYCSEETLFPSEGGGWECRSCLRAFSVTFRGLVFPPASAGSTSRTVTPGPVPAEEQ